ncbi:hypothetical protein CBR_g27884 [Chara braunii]|uniref:HP domain-containing protein n=1 Tax=Chara braunii TaxID=69332 RepID=A0A388L8R0_CHABU|nr:hypothetical protein CBR_g27884 [Chara braunii]|eukprot:GBG78658.1 hypothetical protein CBR_g27884 [Chara braunii]
MSSSSESPWQSAAQSKLARMMKEKEEEYEYCGDVKELIQSRRRGVNQAPKVVVPSCQVLCERVLIKSISLHSVVPLLEFARRFSASTLEEACVKFITASYRTVSKLHAADILKEALGAQIFDWLEAETREMEVGMKRLKVRGKVKDRPLPAGFPSGADRQERHGGAVEGRGAECSTSDPAVSAPSHSGAEAGGACCYEASGVQAREKEGAAEADARQPSQQEKLEEQQQQNCASTGELPASGKPLKVYPYEWLLRGIQWPPDVDPAHREEHLSEKDFVRAFGVSWERFASWPVWRQRLIKQRVSLF